MPLAYIKMIEGSDDEIDNSLPGGGYGGKPSHPIVLPPLPGIWPPPGEINKPIDPGFGHGLPPHPSGGFPIFIQGKPDNPIALPPGIWPPLPPDLGLSGKVAILILVLGVGYRWLIYDTSLTPGLPLPGTPEPK